MSTIERTVAICLLVTGMFLDNAESWAAQPLVDACEVLSHLERFEGKAIEVRGVFYQGTHGAYFIPYPKCEEEDVEANVRILGSAETVRTFFDAGGFKNAWMLANMKGQFRRSARGPTFTLRSMTDLKRVQPYDLSPKKQRTDSGFSQH